MSVTIHFAILANILCCPFIVDVATFELDFDVVIADSTVSEETKPPPEETTSEPSYKLLCATNPWNSPCAGEYAAIISEPENTTILDEVASSWNNRLLNELTMLSMESHASFCPDEDEFLEFLHIAIARTVVDMLTNPSKMQDTYEILVNVTLTAIHDCPLHGRHFFRGWMGMLNDRIQKDSILNNEYNAIRQANSRRIISPARTPFVIVGDDSRLCVFTVFRESLVNRIFMNEAFNLRFFGENTSYEPHNYTVLARKIVELAQQTNDDNQRSLLNQIYKGALLEVALEMTCEGRTANEMKDKLFAILKRHVEGDLGLRSAMDSMPSKFGRIDKMWNSPLDITQHSI